MFQKLSFAIDIFSWLIGDSSNYVDDEVEEIAAKVQSIAFLLLLLLHYN